MRYADLARKTGCKVTVAQGQHPEVDLRPVPQDRSARVAQQYPDIECNEMIVDNTCMRW